MINSLGEKELAQPDDQLKDEFLKSCEYGNFSKMRALALSTNALELEFDGYKPLHSACLSNNLKSIEFLLERNPDVNLRMKNGCTPLMFAASNGGIDAFNLLILRGADINAVDDYGSTALMEAIEYGCYDTALKLAEKGANIFNKNNKGVDALEFILIDTDTDDVFNPNKDEDMIKKLIEIILDKKWVQFQEQETDGNAPDLIEFYKNILKRHEKAKGICVEIITAYVEKLELEHILLQKTGSQTINPINQKKI